MSALASECGKAPFGQYTRIRTAELAREFAFDPCGSNCMTVARSAFIRFGQELLQQSQIYGVNELHKFCPVFQLRGRDPREVFHVQGMLCFMLQKRNKKSLAFKIIRLFYAVDRAVGRGQPPVPCLPKVR